MPGELDDHYIKARTALLDAAEALAPHLDSIVLVGAQAIYLHTGAADIVVAEFTTDADFSVEPALLSDTPLLAELLEPVASHHENTPVDGGHQPACTSTSWCPRPRAGRGRRGADLGPHGRRVARRAVGLEGAQVDHELRTIGSLDPVDDRSVTMKVAGPGALIVAKAHKLWERTTNDDRVRDKDALDVYRLLQAIPTNDLAARLARLRESPEAADVTATAIEHLRVLFGARSGAGIELAVRATRAIIDREELSLSLITLTADLLEAL